MADLVINDDDAQRLREIAERENRPIEEVISRMIEIYTQHNQAPVQADDVRSYHAKLYKYARRYWQQEGNTERLALTDEQLDEQFWCIDPEGIPRLKSDQGSVSLPSSDGVLAYLNELWKSNPSGEVEEPFDYREFLNKEFPEYLMRRMQENDDPSSSD
jgi:hypothetical protein